MQLLVRRAFSLYTEFEPDLFSPHYYSPQKLTEPCVGGQNLVQVLQDTATRLRAKGRDNEPIAVQDLGVDRNYE
jgi:hypothetical protein